MATLYVRNVPEQIYGSLRTRASRSGRSINSEAVEILAEAAAVEASHTPIVDRLREIAARIDLPPDAPTPEELIRELRDAAPPGL
jgi:plasmid stability protein